MGECKISSGLAFSCADLLRVGGVFPDFWVFYLSELDTAIDLNQAADINTLDFGSYGGLRRFSGAKFAHSAEYEWTKGAGGNVSCKHMFMAKVLPDSTADDLTLKNLALGKDIAIVFQDNNRNFFIVGPGTGLSEESDKYSTGTTGDSDQTNSITLTGQETVQFLRFRLGAGYQATLDYLESREL